MKVITYGELMLRLSTIGYDRFIQSNAFEIQYGGAEANVSVALANWGLNSCFVTKLPKHELGNMALNSLRKYGVDTSMIVRDGERLGLYFLEQGASQRNSQIIYDRANSAFANAQFNEFNWDYIFADASWFHFTGITLALGKEHQKIVEYACVEGKKRGIKISCDLNYRNKLWTKNEARDVLSHLLSYVDVCITNMHQAMEIFQINNSTVDSKKAKTEIARYLSNQFELSAVAFTFRNSINVDRNLISGMLYEDNEAYFSCEYDMNMVDRIGGGDAFSAGIIYGHLQSMDYQKLIDFAAAASCIKHSIKGDYCLCSVDEVMNLINKQFFMGIQR